MLALALLFTACSDAQPAATSGCGPDLPGFEHRTAQMGATRLHYVVGGQGPPVVLLHGFPETWYAWRGVAPRLAARHTVLAPDLRGVGCSSLEPAGYDKETMAADVHRLVTGLGFERVALVGHDVGGWVAFAYARSYPDQVSHLVLSGVVLPGFGLQRLGPPHLASFMQPGLVERRVAGREREFFARFVGGPETVGRAAFDRYVAAYSRPGRLSAALGLYRALRQDAADNRRGLAAPLPMPTMALGGGDGVSRTAESLRQVARDVQVRSVPGAGHYVPEQDPAAFAAAVLDFLSRPR